MADSIIKEGYLTKAPMSVGERTSSRKLTIKKDKKRYFVLTATEMKYYEKKTSSKPKGTVSIGRDSTLSDAQFSVYGFVLIPSPSSNKKLYMAANSEHEKEDWITAINSVISPNKTARRSADKRKSWSRQNTKSLRELVTPGAATSLLVSELLSADEEAIRMQGYLMKRGGGEGGTKSWKKRFFVLARDLMYFDSEQDYNALMSNQTPDSQKARIFRKRFYLDAYSVTKRGKHADVHFDFVIYNSKKALICRASSEGERDAWINVLMKPFSDSHSNGMLECLYDADMDHQAMTKKMEDQHIKSPVQRPSAGNRRNTRLERSGSSIGKPVDRKSSESSMDANKSKRKSIIFGRRK